MLSGAIQEPLPGARFLKAFDRRFMRIGLQGVAALPRGSAADRVHIATWQDWHQESAAYLIPEAYRGHIDSRINDQYDTVSGARRFLYNIVQYPGCGTFFRPASYIALDRETGVLTALSLTRSGRAGCRPYHPDLRSPGLARHGTWIRIVAAFPGGTVRSRLSKRHPYRDRRQPGRHRSLQSRRVRNHPEISRDCLGRVLMVQEILSNVQNVVRGAFIHLGNADLLTIGLVIAGIALIGFFLLRR
jgi:hypothetical protein